MKTITSYRSIVLTEEQKERMLVMSNMLFPNRGWCFWEDDVFGHTKKVFEKQGKTYPRMQTHWMEFLLYKLIPAFCKKAGPLTMTWNMMNMTSDVNMIDKFFEKYFSPYYEGE